MSDRKADRHGVHTHPFMLRLTDAEHEALRERARVEERTMAQVVRRALAAYLAHAGIGGTDGC